jgi:signal transduction histidine kinase
LVLELWSFSRGAPERASVGGGWSFGVWSFRTMTIRTRMTFWYSGILLVSALIIVGLSIRELHEQKTNTEPPEEGVEDIVQFVCWIGIPAVLLSIGGGWWLMRKAFAPLAMLTQAAERINEHNLSEQLPRTHNGDELDRLAEVLNGMTGRLNDAFKRVHEFTLHASHELKTPLTVLCGETETELRDDAAAPAQRERAASRLDELHRLARIVDGLTLLAKADAGLVDLKREPVKFDALVRDSFDDLEILAESPGIEVELKGCEPAVVTGDADRLRQLLLNLADNAIKYNKLKGSIGLGLKRVGETAEFTISNTGPGIATEAMPRVFDRFFRGDPAHNNAVDGCGLGLSIAKWIVSAHGGTICIDSAANALTTVRITLPVVKEGAA